MNRESDYNNLFPLFAINMKRLEYIDYKCKDDENAILF